MSTAQIVVVLLVAIDLSFRLIALVIVPPNRRPQTSMAWLLAIFFIPFVAFLAFLAFGSHKLSPKRRRKQQAINTFLHNQATALSPDITISPDELATRADTPPWLPPVVTLTNGLAKLPLTRGNDIEFLDDYEGVFARMAADIDTAQTTVNALFYIMSTDPDTDIFFTALENAVIRGVTVRVLFDQVATRRITGSQQLIQRLKASGVEFHPMLPFEPWRGVYQRPDLRNHRKILVIDSDVAYTGSQNIIESGYRDKKHKKRGLHWHDMTLRVRGPLVHSLEAVFITDWFHETDDLLSLDPPGIPTPQQKESAIAPTASIAQVVPSGPAIDGETNLRLFLEMMYGATKRILIVSPYVVPDDSMRYAITSASLRGVRVDMVVSEIGDQPLVFHAQRSYYEEFLQAGVNLWWYPAPTILHPKFFVVDDHVAVIGSSNLDMRSFTLNLELTILLVGDPAVSELTAFGDDYIQKSHQLTLDQWQRRPRGDRIKEGLARLTATVQ
jgi:cardiolipin synthase A/B